MTMSSVRVSALEEGSIVDPRSVRLRVILGTDISLYKILRTYS
jgi:hypothetical protein